MRESPVLHDLLLAYVQCVLVQSAQLVLCTSKHRLSSVSRAGCCWRMICWMMTFASHTNAEQ